MQTVRIEADLNAAFSSSDSSCSVIWIVPDSDPRELGRALASVTASTAMAAWGFVGAWERSKLIESWAAEIAEMSQGSAEYVVGDTRMKADALALPPTADAWFWTQFGRKIRPHQICGALVPPSAESRGWRFAGLQLVLAAASLQARPGVTHSYTLRSLEQAFLAEVVAVDGIAVTRLRAELLPPGIALTSTSRRVDGIAATFSDAPTVDPLLTERSRLLSGNW
jgi:hypothetical protein